MPWMDHLLFDRYLVIHVVNDISEFGTVWISSYLLN
jgi:hypothetical protein